MMGFEHGYALLIGVDESREAGLMLPGVEKDVAALQAVLVHEARCGYPAEQVRVITGVEATRGGILDGLDWLTEQVEADASGNATAVVYFSGHGWREVLEAGAERYYLIPFDVNLKRVRSSALEAEVFADAVAGLGSQRLLVVLDCCHAGGMGVKGVSGAVQYMRTALPVGLMLPAAGGVTAKGANQELSALQQGAGRAVLSSSQGSEQSYLRQDGAMSVFTYHLIEALTGHAQPEGGATEVLVSDVLGHVYRKVPQSAQAAGGGSQHPDYKITGNFPVALLLGGKGLAEGVPAPDPLAAVPATLSATNMGSGAIAQGERAVAAGERGVAIGGDVSGSTIVTGDRNQVDRSSRAFDQRGQTVGGSQTNIAGDVDTGGGLFNSGTINTGGGDLVGRDMQGQRLEAAELALLFAPLLRAAAAAPAGQRAEVVMMVEALKAEAAKGPRAQDSTMAQMIEEFVALVPGAVSAVVSAFASPILAGVAGPITQYVLGKLRGGKGTKVIG